MIFKFIISLLIGALCGWLAGKFMKSKHGFLLNIILGIVGGFVGNFLFGLLGVSFGGLIGNIVCSVLGACILIWVVRLFKK